MSEWSLRTVLDSPRESWEMLRLYRSVMSRISIDMNPNKRVSLRCKFSSRREVRHAFKHRDIDLLNAFYDYFSDYTGTYFITMAMTAYRGTTGPVRQRGFTGQDMITFMTAYESLKSHENDDRTIDDDTIISLARAGMQHPHRVGEFHMELVKRGIPSGDITTILDEMMTGSVLYEGAL